MSGCGDGLWVDEEEMEVNGGVVNGCGICRVMWDRYIDVFVSVLVLIRRIMEGSYSNGNERLEGRRLILEALTPSPVTPNARSLSTPPF